MVWGLGPGLGSYVRACASGLEVWVQGPIRGFRV